MENWDDYRLILALHRGKTLRNAAQQLALNHSTVSRRLATLNQKYGTDIFDLSPKGYTLTPLGKSLLQSAEKIEQLAINDNRSKRAHQKDLSGLINLSIPPAIGQFLLRHELHEFQQQYPEISLNVQTSYQITDLNRCEADIVIRVSEQPAEHLVGHSLFPIMLSYYAAKSYLVNTSADEYRWITNTYDSIKPSWIEQSPYPTADVALRIEDLVLRHYAAADGQGMILGACYIADSMPKLQRIDHDITMPHQNIWVLTHPDLKQIPRIKVLMKFLTSTLRAKEKFISGNAI
jgi:DNA-binding transcriptional LysR family regulator